LSSAQARLVEARSNYERMRDLVAEDAVSRAQYDQAEALRKTAEAQVTAAQSQVSLADNRLSYTRLVSSVTGVVTARGPEPGEIVAPGRMVVQVAREGARDAVFDVPVHQEQRAPRHPDIRVALASDPAVSAAGKVREIAPRADPVTGTFQVRVRLIDPPAAMRLGSDRHRAHDAGRRAGIEIPTTALVRSGGQGVGVARRSRPPRPYRCARSRSAHPAATPCRSPAAWPTATSSSPPACRRCARARR
jgi:RND family efflux transporter MFP subunit